MTPRFAVDEGWKQKKGAWTKKVRAIDDFAASGVNDATAPSEQIRSARGGRAARERARSREDADAGRPVGGRQSCCPEGQGPTGKGGFRGCIQDSAPQARRARPEGGARQRARAVRAEDLPLANAAFAESLRDGRVLQLWACPFGAVSSVHAWERLGTAMQARRGASACLTRGPSG